MLDYINSYLSDPLNMLIILALALPGRLMAISMHEAAHAWVADRCGDPTARMLGRVTLNPLKHLDVVGTLMMVFVGFGWAKPVPVNPRNFRNYRRDDLLVSIAGVTTNFIMFLISVTVLYAIAGLALSRIIEGGTVRDPEAITYFLEKPYYFSQVLIAPVYGKIAGYAYEMLMYFVLTNLVLALFNLIPIPPLDGYHVLNDLFLRRSNVFASPQVARMTTTALYILMITGVVSRGIGFVQEFMFSGAGSVFGHIFRALSIY